jgi:hypothetical protein
MDDDELKHQEFVGDASETSQDSDVQNQSKELSSRKSSAQQLPFLLRAWWLREFQESKDFAWRQEPYITGPVWSTYADPLCQMSGLDYSYDQSDD